MVGLLRAARPVPTAPHFLPSLPNHQPCASQLQKGAATEGAGTRGASSLGDWRCPRVRSPTPRLAALLCPCRRQVAVLHHRSSRIRRRHQVTEENYQRRKTSHPKKICIAQGHDVEYSKQETLKKEICQRKYHKSAKLEQGLNKVTYPMTEVCFRVREVSVLCCHQT